MQGQQKVLLSLSREGLACYRCWLAPGGGLLALPAPLVESIQKGEFVDLRELLPDNVFEAIISVGDKEKDKKKKNTPIEPFQE